MTLYNLKDYIDIAIIERGIDYFNSRAVSKLSNINSRLWKAEVGGLEVYNIEVHLSKEEIKGWHCSCPYDSGPLCKHVVATIMAITKTLEEKKSDSLHSLDNGSSSDKLAKLYQLHFPHFEHRFIETSETSINAVIGGSGPPLLLLHGYPENLLMWRGAASALSQYFTIVATDLRGYGMSGKPKTDEEHLPYSKHKMAKDQVEVMESLHFSEFMVAGHDRGARVAHRMALDYPQKIQRLAILDILPTLQLYQEADMHFGKNYWHWFFLIQPYPLPETLLGNNIDFIAGAIFSRLAQSIDIPGEILESYKRNFSDPDTLRATCEDYRAGASIDLEQDETDLDQLIECPTLVLWGNENPVYQKREMIKEWEKRAKLVKGQGLPCGHFIPEELPEATIQAFIDFFKYK